VHTLQDLASIGPRSGSTPVIFVIAAHRAISPVTTGGNRLLSSEGLPSINFSGINKTRGDTRGEG